MKGRIRQHRHRAASPPKRGSSAERLEVRIDSLAAGGDGVGRAPDGRVVFVPDTAPGDRVRVQVVVAKTRHVRGRVEALLEASPSRTDPVCAVFGSCGGCAWQHVDYPTQLDAKRAILANAVRRIADLPLPEDLVVEASPEPYGYRGRARVAVSSGRVGFRRRRSEALCPTSRCPVLVPALADALAELAADPPSEDGEWELVAGTDGGICVAPVGGAGDGNVQVEVAGDRLRVSPGVFVQSNSLLHGVLAEAVHAAAGRGEVAVELFAGMGFLTLGLARRFRKVVAVEGDAAGVADLEHNCRAARLSNVEVLGLPVEQVLAPGGPLPHAADVLVVDPPRAGLPSSAIDGILGLEPSRIVMLSCDPATLARDLRALASGGFRLVGLRGFDLFPQTAHVEALAVLDRLPVRDR